MPFLYDQSQIEMPDDGYDLPPPRVDQFEYVSSLGYGGARGVVTFSIDVPDKPAPIPGPTPTPAATASPRRGFFDRLFGGARAATPERAAQRVRDAETRKALRHYNRHLVLSLAVLALREIGGRRAYCRYDGGNDEGFCWLDSVELANGECIDVTAVAQKLYDLGLHERLHAAGLVKSDPKVTGLEQVQTFARIWPSTEWAGLLLGESYGTGEYVMYGAFTVDLEACTLVDDPQADPVVENIEIAS